jgi:16S rRNA processing protein RimM
MTAATARPRRPPHLHPKQPESVPRPALLQLGYVSRAHGLQGELAIKTFDPASDALFEVERVTLQPRGGEPRDMTLEQVRGAGKELLVCLAGVDDRSTAEGLVGATVWVARAALEAPAEGEYFQGDLVGLEAVNEAGLRLGRVEEVWNTGPVPNLVIRGEGREIIVPFADDFVPVVDLDAGRLVVREPELVE